MNLLTFHSLRSRYTAVAILLTLAVVGGALVAQNNVSGARRSTSANIEVRNGLLQVSRHARNAVWRAREALSAFLLDPHRGTYSNQVHGEIHQAEQFVSRLAKRPWVRQHRESRTLARLQRSLRSLDQATTTLMATRMQASKEYPALAFARGQMLPRHKEFFTAARLAMNEILASNPTAIRSTAYQHFVEARHLWTTMISDFRMYLANRLGSFNEQALPMQERTLELEYRQLVAEMTALQKLDRAGQLDLQSRASLSTMSQASRSWHQDLQRVEEIDHSGNWRADKKQIRDTVEPLFNGIWNSLLTFDGIIESSANADVQALSQVAEQQSHLIWLLAGLGVIFIALGSVVLERSVLRPIAVIANALKSEPLGGHTDPLLGTGVSETRSLVDAFSEMRHQVRSRQLALEHQALHDALTDLPNRNLLLDRLQQAIAAGRRDDSSLALLIMDLDRFKEINDTLGHQVGDRLLEEVGSRLLDTLREMDTVARLGGDEFAVLLPNTGAAQARHTAIKMLAALDHVFKVDGHRLRVGASIGIAVFPQHGADGQTLIQRADVAMYIAKRNKAGVTLYDPGEDQHSVGRLALMSDLYNALDSDALELHYQPKVRISDGKVVGAEALLRWHHPKYGTIPPDEVIPLAEQTGLIRSLTFWVLGRAIQECRRWHQRGLHLSVAVNLSVYNLQDADLVDEIKRQLSRHRLPAEYLTLEITESGMMSDPANAIQILSALDRMGVQLAVDDFGTGFSSLTYLKQLPVDELKIDKSFVVTMTQDDNDAVIVRSMIDLAHNLGLRVVAEGVEAQDVRETLEILGCDQGQGHHMSMPLPADEFDAWIDGQTDKRAIG